jgi:hypothetical protein
MSRLCGIALLASAPAASMAPVLAALSTGCRAKGDAVHESSEGPATVRVERSATSYRTRSVVEGRAIDVRVEMATRRPAPAWSIPRMVQSQCGGADHVVDEALSASTDGGANGAVVWLDDIHEGRPLVPAKAVQDEVRCAFTPHILALPAAGTLTLSNGDASNHAVRFDFEGDLAEGFMKTLPAGASVGVPIQEDWAGKVARVTCPIHLWMYGYALFFDHPYFAVTDAGAARIEGVPPGSYHLVVWHEGTTSTYDSKVVLSPPRTIRVEVVVGEADVKRGFVIADDGTMAAR